jgi:hypothetical protein
MKFSTKTLLFCAAVLAAAAFARPALAAAPTEPFLNDKVDSNNDNQLWKMEKNGDYVTLIPKSNEKLIVDANGAAAKKNIYLSDKPEKDNNNQLWKMEKHGDFVMFFPKINEKVALDANGAKNGAKPFFNDKIDEKNDNELWSLEKHGDYYVITSKQGKAALDAGIVK